MKQKIMTIIFMFLLVVELASALGYGQGSYGIEVFQRADSGLFCGDGTCNNGETCSSCSSDCGVCPVTSTTTTGGGSSSSKCYYDWECTNWIPSICPETGVRERICLNRGTCEDTKEMPNQTQTCEYLGAKEPLFDIYLTLDEKNKEICTNKKIKANVKLENYGKVELLDAFMTYWIIDENNKLIAELKDTRAIEKETSFNVEMQIPEFIGEGTYRIYAEITYSGNKTAVSGESFEILAEEKCKFSLNNFNMNYIIYSGAGVFGILIVAYLTYLLRKKFKKVRIHLSYRKRISENLRRITAKHYLTVVFIIIALTLFKFNSFTGFAINTENTGNFKFIFVFVAVLVAIWLIIVFRKKIMEIARKLIELAKFRKEKHAENSLIGLIKKDVLTESGFHIGKIEDVVIEGNKIVKLKIGLKEKKKFTFKGIIIQYSDVKSIGHVVIVENSVFEGFN